MNIREDFRRDGLAANFLVDANIMRDLVRVIPGSKLNIGYPSICVEEKKACQNILTELSGNGVELSVVGHSKEAQLRDLASVISGYENVAANSWIPISDHFLKQTVNLTAQETFRGLKHMIKLWHTISDKPFDIAFADCTSYEDGLPERIYDWVNYALHNGVRNVIVCDTRGIGTPEQVKDIFSLLSSFGRRIEFHPHNDNGHALENVRVALKYGVETIGTSFYCAAERNNMLDPRELIDLGLTFDIKSFERFDSAYRSKLGNPEDFLPDVFGLDVIVTGSQYRLRKRDPCLKMKFGATTDTYIASCILGQNVSTGQLAYMKDQYLYREGRMVMTQRELVERFNKRDDLN